MPLLHFSLECSSLFLHGLQIKAGLSFLSCSLVPLSGVRHGNTYHFVSLAPSAHRLVGKVDDQIILKRH
jgi:hypothetical protein